MPLGWVWKLEWRALLLQIRRQIVAVRHYGLDVHEVEVAVHLRVDGRGGFGPRLELPTPDAARLDRLIVAAVACVADDGDGDLIIRRGQRGRDGGNRQAQGGERQGKG